MAPENAKSAFKIDTRYTEDTIDVFLVCLAFLTLQRRRQSNIIRTCNGICEHDGEECSIGTI